MDQFGCMKSSLYYLIFAFWYIISLLPLRLLYIFSDLLYFPLYYCIRYRRKVVRQNLISSFPEKSLNEILCIEKRFYSYFCDYLMETVKLFSMSKKQMQKRMHFEGIEEGIIVIGNGSVRFLCIWAMQGLAHKFIIHWRIRLLTSFSYTCADASELHPYKWTTLSEPF